MKLNPIQQLHLEGRELFTTVHGRPELSVAFVLADQDDCMGTDVGELALEICRRFNNFVEPMPTHWIERVAIMYEGELYHLPKPARHHDVIREIARLNGVGIQGEDVQGFLDNDGEFVNREQALTIALAANQVLDANNIRADQLFSEDLW